MRNNFLKSSLEKRSVENTLRSLNYPSDLADFTSNDYLGLARSEELFSQIQKKIVSLPHRNGSSGSRLLSGNSKYTEDVEERLASIFKSEAALIFNSGYGANQGVISSILQKGDTIIYDALAHACMKDGARLSLAKRLSFKHNDLNDLDSKLRKSSGRIYIAVESIYSMDGDVCPLKELTDLAEKYDATVILDEAHSTGVMGKGGSGLAVSLGLEERIGVRIYTFGKAMGIHGACVAGSTTLRSYLINFARPFIYTTALPPHSIAAIDCAFEYLSGHMELQQQLVQKINRYSEPVSKFIPDTVKSTAIQTVIIPGNDIARQAAQKLQQQGFDVRAILSPTVAQGTERLRICLHTFNHDEQIASLTQSLKMIIANL